MATIERDVSLLQRRRVAPIYIVYGSAVQIQLNMIDYTIPTNATVEFFAQCGSGPVYRASGTATGNSAAFTPPEGFFRQGDNALQLEINEILIPLAIDVKCEERISGVGSEETPEQVRPLVLKAQDAAREANASQLAAAGSAGEAAGSADAAGKSAADALQSKNAAAGSADAAAGSAQEAAESKAAAAGSASDALQSKNEAAGSSNEALNSKNAAASSADSAAGSASAAAGSAGAAAGSAQEALERMNAAAGSASAAALSAQTAREAMEKTTEIAVKTPYIGANGNWFVWSSAADSYVDSGVKAQGPQGIPGTGNVSSVCGVIPGDDGNVPLTASDVGALPASGLLSKTYPVGAIYLSASETSPASLFGGTWERLKDRFLLAAGDSYTVGSTGGEAKHTLTVDEMPSHEGHMYSNFDSSGYADRGGDENSYLLNSSLITGYDKYENRPYKIVSGNELIMQGYSRGGNTAHNNMPPYLAVYMWKRVA